MVAYRELWRTRREAAFYWSFFLVLFVGETVFAIVYGGLWFSLVGVFGASISLLAIITAIKTGDDRLGNVFLMIRRRRNREWNDRDWRI